MLYVAWGFGSYTWCSGEHVRSFCLLLSFITTGYIPRWSSYTASPSLLYVTWLGATSNLPMVIKISKFYRMQSWLQVFVEIFFWFFLMTSKGQDSIMVSEDIGSCWVANVTMGLWSQQAIWVLMELLEPPYMHQDRPVDWVGEPLGWRHWDWDFNIMGHRLSGTRFSTN